MSGHIQRKPSYNELVAQIEALVAERDAALHSVINCDDLIVALDKVTAERDALRLLVSQLRGIYEKRPE